MKDIFADARWARASVGYLSQLFRRQPLNRWISALDVALVLALAYICARLFWVWAEPLPEQADAFGPTGSVDRNGFAGDRDFANLIRFDPFHREMGGNSVSRAVPGAEANAPETQLNLKLYGIRAASRETGAGSAIIRTPEKKQVAVEVGDPIMNGVVLRRVFTDHVVIEREGVLESLYLEDEETRRRQRDRLNLPNRGPGELPEESAAASAPETPPVQSGGRSPAETDEVPLASAMHASQFEFDRHELDAADLLDQIQLRPRVDHGQLDGFYIQPRGDARLFRHVGLEPGDVLLAINGRKIQTPDMITDLAAGLDGSDSVRVELERSGRKQTLTIALNNES